jgi:hypothetical protein
MATGTVRLEEATRRALRRAFGKVRAQAEAVHVELPEGSAPLDGPDEVLVLVLGARGGFVSRRTTGGRPVDLRELGLRLAGAEVAVEGLARQPAAQSPPLTAAEAALLDEDGLVEGERDRPGAFEKSQIEFELLVNQSFTLQIAASILAVNPSRLRQRLAQRTLYGIKEGGSWRIPTFQFDARRKKLVRGIEKVLPHIRADAHPLAVASWFSTPHQDLVVGEEETPVTPLQWLAGGRPSDPVADLAKEI